MGHDDRAPGDLSDVLDVRLSSLTASDLLLSQTDVPLVHELIPILELLQTDLIKVRDSPKLPDTIRLAAICDLYYSTRTARPKR